MKIDKLKPSFLILKKPIFKNFFIGIIILGLIFYFCLEIYSPKTKNSNIEKPFFIEKEKSIYRIACDLEKEKFIKNRWSFLIYLIFTGKYKKIQAGEYLLSPSLNIVQITEKFFKGERIKRKITIIEGWNLEEIADYLENQGLAKKDDFLETAKKDFSDEFDFLKDKPKDLSLEGYLFPDTYEVEKGETSEEIIKKMLKNFDRKLNSELREEISRQKKSIFEVVVMASLIEKEVKNFEDKRIVSGILWKRLEKNIPLQVDATINYITGEKTIKISEDKLKIDSPYNTYKYKGLPKGPISNPSLESIKAAIYPKETQFFYYLAISDKVIFSRTLKEHNLAKEKYLR